MKMLIIQILLALALGITAGMALESWLEKPPVCNCPDPNIKVGCPEPRVEVQPFDVEKIKNVRGFTYAPTFTGNVSADMDTASVRRMIREEIQNAAREPQVPKRRGKLFGAATSYFVIPPSDFREAARRAKVMTDSAMRKEIDRLMDFETSL
jgi:hypothetical protein